jgi:WhiB family transcriptional regulator, redox-sensing transcriptional regulator
LKRVRGWALLAACKDIDPEIFFSFGAGRYNNRKVNQAKNICNRCPVTGDCLRENMGAQFGIFGGLTPLERWRLIGMPGRPTMVSLTYPQWDTLFEKSVDGARLRRKVKTHIYAIQHKGAA